ncbi:MAG: DUF4956 domain-containing protein [Oscillospiraceae bacterium]|nr:DUF4956 domain-containing protein [Oscillospiraceae bacterium]
MPADSSLSITQSVLANGLTPLAVALCALCAIVIGLTLAELHRRGGEASQSFLVTLATLPLLVQLVIMAVNGNLGAGVAVAGTFSLVRFRSLPGGAREIGAIFCAMALGLIVGMGYLIYSIASLVIIAAFQLALTALISARSQGKGDQLRVLKVTIPETLDYEGAFDDLLAEYTLQPELIKVKTTNMGSLFELTYSVRMKDSASTKSFLDALRTRNGNLTLSLSREMPSTEIL